MRLVFLERSLLELALLELLLIELPFLELVPVATHNQRGRQTLFVGTEQDLDAEVLVEHRRLLPTLYSGFVGIGWVITHLSREIFEGETYEICLTNKVVADVSFDRRRALSRSARTCPARAAAPRAAWAR